jgi:hypothetical protein
MVSTACSTQGLAWRPRLAGDRSSAGCRSNRHRTYYTNIMRKTSNGCHCRHRQTGKESQHRPFDLSPTCIKPGSLRSNLV